MSKLVVHKAGKTLELDLHLSEDFGDVEVRLHSDRNATISKLSDVHPNDPEREKRTASMESKPNDIWFPLVDIVSEPGMEAVAVCLREKGASYHINSMFFQEAHELEREIVIPTEHLMDWENGISIDTREAQVDSFYLRKRLWPIPIVNRRIQHRFELLSEDWDGRVSVHAEQEGRVVEIASAQVSRGPAPPASASPADSAPDLDRSVLIDALNDSVQYVLNSRILSAASPLKGGLYVLYDYDYRTYRMPQWPWAWGPAIGLLVEVSRLSPEMLKHDPERILEAADAAGKASLKVQVWNETHPTHGLGTTRWNPRFVPFGYEELVSGESDSNFLNGWAWIPLYEATGDDRYLTAAKLLVESTERMTREFSDSLVPQDYLCHWKDWTAHTLDESGFGVEGIEALYRITGDAHLVDVGTAYMEQHLARFDTGDGLWSRQWLWKVMKAKQCIHGARAIGWAAEGLLATYRLTKKEKYLDRALVMAEHMMSTQRPDGAWTTITTGTVEHDGMSEKATALWSLLLYRFYEHTGEEKCLSAARNALKWCIGNQYRGSDKQGYGGQPVESRNSGIVYRQWSRISCIYTVAFFGHAILKELGHQKHEK